MSNPHPAKYSEVEAEVEHLNQLRNTVVKRITPSKSSDPAVPAFMSLVPKHGKEVKMTANDMTYKIELLKNQIQQMKKADARRSVSFSDLCMFSDFECPHEFRMPKFEKYKGVGCPWTHLHSYGIAMSQYANNEKLLIQTFLNSLTGPAAIWFIQLEKTKINS